MRYYAGIVICAATFTVLMAGAIALILSFSGVDSSVALEFVVVNFATEIFVSMIAGYALLLYLLDETSRRFARVLAKSQITEFATAFALLVLFTAVVCFAPLASAPLWVVASVATIAIPAAWLAGALRGMIMCHGIRSKKAWWLQSEGKPDDFALTIGPMQAGE